MSNYENAWFPSHEKFLKINNFISLFKMLQFFWLLFSAISYSPSPYTCSSNCPPSSDFANPIDITPSNGEYCNCPYGSVDITFGAANKIPAHLFYGATVKSVKLSSSIQSIGECAFQGTTIINSIDFSGATDLQEIENGAFYHTVFPQKTKLKFPNSVNSVGNGVFENLNILTLDFSDTTISSIGDGFCYNAKITNVNFPSSLYSINSYAFQISNIGTLDLSGLNRELTIGDYAFDGATISSLTLPSYVSTLPNSAFRGCTITTFDCHETSFSINLGDLPFYESTITTLILGPSLLSTTSGTFAGSDITTVDLTSVKNSNSNNDIFKDAKISAIKFNKDSTTVFPSLFQNCEITKVDLAQYPNIETIGSSAFKDSKIVEITISNNLKTIGANSFQNSFVNIEFSKFTNLEKINANAFQHATITPTSQEFPSLLNSIGNEAFYETSLTSITFSENNNHLSIGKSSFKDILTLTQATIHAKSIDESAFQGCVNMVVTGISIEGSGQISENAFLNCYQLNGPLTVSEYSDKRDDEPVYTSILGKAFMNSGITAIKLPQVKTIGGSAFQNCTKLGPSGTLHAETISSYAFEGDAKLAFTSIRAKEIQGHAFEKCRVLNAEITLDLNGQIGSYAFADCTLLKTVKFTEVEELDIPTYNPVLIDSYLFSVSDHAFYQSGLTSPLVLPLTLNDIGSYAFAYCPNLESVTIEGTYYVHKYISDYAFYHSALGNNLVIPNTVVSIDSYAFAFCPITSLTIIGSNHEIDDEYDSQGNQIKGWKGTKIADNAFYECNKLATLSLEENKISFDTTTFRECPISNLSITV